MSGQPEEEPDQWARTPQPVFLRPWFRMLVVGGICLIVGFALASKQVPPAPSSAQHSSPALRSSLTKPSRPATGRAAPLDGTGSYLVGHGVRPGLYRSVGNTRASGCHWSRSSPVAQGSPVGTAQVALLAGDYFDTSHCMPWSLQPSGASPQ